MKIKIQIKSCYGRELIYPICEKAKTFAKLVDKITLTNKDIQYIQELGYEIEKTEEKKNPKM